MDEFFQDDWQIQYLCEPGSTEVICQEDTRKVFDFYISYTDLQISQRKDSLTESTQSSSQLILDSSDMPSINAAIDLEDDQDDFFVGQSYQNKLSKKSSFDYFIKIPSLQKSLIFINSFSDDENEASTPYLQDNVLPDSKTSSYIQYQEEVSILFDYQTKPKSKVKSKKPRITHKRRVSRAIRKGKNKQSCTQKFLKYMTKFHYNKNFKQFFNKGIANHKFDPKKFPEYEVEKKIEIINLIIEKEVQEYEMKMHYSVQKGNFLKGFGRNQQFIKDLFHQVVKRVYTLMFETCKRQMFYPEEEGLTEGYLDSQGEKEFQEAFEEILQTRKYYTQLLECDFEKRLWKEIEG